METGRAEGDMSKLQNQTENETNAICNALTHFVREHFPLAQRRNLQPGDPLIESGIVDSLGILDVVAFVEAEFGVRVEDEDLVPENFQSVAQIASYVEKKRRVRGNNGQDIN
jgi:acyl carrier protein